MKLLKKNPDIHNFWDMYLGIAFLSASFGYEDIHSWWENHQTQLNSLFPIQLQVL